MTLKYKLIIIGLLLSGVGLMSYALHLTFVVPSQAPASLPGKIGAIVRLVKGDRTFCTGTVVSDHVIITAAHCVLTESPFGAYASPEPIEIRGRDNTPVKAAGSVYYATPQMDQAILIGDFTKFEHKRIITNFTRLTEIGEEGRVLVSCGYPLMGDLVCTKLIFTKKHEFFWGVNGSLYPGMSGGPTMLTDGSVVAVNTAVTGDESIVSPIYNLTQALRFKK